jgi:hypothetical protein
MFMLFNVLATQQFGAYLLKLVVRCASCAFAGWAVSFP